MLGKVNFVQNNLKTTLDFETKLKMKEATKTRIENKSETERM